MKKTHPGLSSYALQHLRTHFRLQDSIDSTAHRAFSDVEWTVQILAIALKKALDTPQ
jgi:DNA polymerase III epsilon subunit-like protein